MFKKINGGTVVNIQGLDCWIPPVGTVFNKFTNKFEKREVYKRSDVKSEQYWEIPPKPENVKDRLIEEADIRETNPSYFDSELQSYRETEWDRRINGFWFYNNGTPTYITGVHYFYMAHWFIDIGYPGFRIPNLHLFYFWQYCLEDPDCFGMVEVTRRRDGKSYRAACIQYEATSRVRRKHSGIQSKDEESAQTFFDVHIVQPFTELEHMFKPIIDTDKGDMPKKVLRMFKSSSKTSSISTRNKNRKKKDLRSKIDYRASGEKLYDGKKMLIYVRDEAGKVEKANVYEAHNVIKWCLSDEESIIGKAIYTTTVEDIKDDDLYETDGNFRRLWDDSNQFDKGLNNRTKTGLYRYFLPAYEAMNYDKYGYPDVERNKIWLMNERSNLEGNTLAKYIRKFPFTIEEAFWTSADGCIFNKTKIQNQRMELALIKPEDIYDIGNLQWKDNKFGSKVIFVENPNGRFKFLKSFNVRQECSNENTVVDFNGLFKPLRKAQRIIGVDPADHKNVEDGSRKSNISIYLYIKYNPLDKLSETFVCEYLYRPDDPESFYSELCMLAFLSGAEMMIENQKPGAINYAEKVGFQEFIIRYGSGVTGGIPASTPNKQLLADNWEVYIDNNIEKILFPNLLKDLSMFNLIKSTKFDAAMGAGWALVGAYGARAIAMNNVETPKAKVYDPSLFY